LLKFFLLFTFILTSSVKAEVTIYKSWNIPEFANPNFETLRFYLKRQLTDPEAFDKWNVKPSQNTAPLKGKLRKNLFLDSQMQSSSIVSYLLYNDGAIIYDEKSPQNRFGDLVDDQTKLLSNSVGKSLVSYLVGHAICAGFLKGVDEKLNDWPIIQNTLYHDQKLIDLLNMSARDEKYVDDVTGMRSTGRWYNTHSIKSFANRELKDSRPGEKWSQGYKYNGFITNIIMNYVIHKSGSNFQDLLNDIFQKKAGIAYPVFFFKNKWQRFDNGKLNKSLPTLNDEDGRAWYMFYASRYDYLRIAIAILEDWQTNSCVGKYLKTVYERRINKNLQTNHARLKHSVTYAGQFHTNFTGMSDRHVMGMEGYGGQSILIDFDNSRIVVLNTIHDNFNWYELVLQAIKNGKIKGNEKELQDSFQALGRRENPTPDSSSNERPKSRINRSKESLTTRFTCLKRVFQERDLSGFPTPTEIEKFITNLSNYRFIEKSYVSSATDTEKVSHFQLSKLGLPRSSVIEHKKLFLELVNFNGEAEQYCDQIYDN